MKPYASSLRRDDGTAMVLDRTRLLLAFREPPPLGILLPRLRELGVDLETTSDADDTARREAINHTDRRFWVRSPIGESLDQLLDVLTEAFADLAWIGPVYHHPDVPGRAGLHCPVPNALLVADSIDQVPLREDEQKSRLLPGYRYYTVDNPADAPAHQVREQLIERGSLELDDVLLDNMPMVVPLSIDSIDPLYPGALPGYQGQWNMRNIRAGGPGQTAWDITVGRPDVTIAVLDSGCDKTHPDLRIASGGRQFGGAGTDSGGYPPTAVPGFPRSHGTMVAGIAGAIYNDTKGLAGVAGGCSILPLAFTNFTESETASAINYATTRAHVINMSFSSNLWNPALINKALAVANSNNVTFCGSTGNRNEPVAFPAKLPEVIACGATGWTDQKLDFSNYGTRLSVMAPGVDIPTTTLLSEGNLGDPYARHWVFDFDGTSASVAHVSGLAALIVSALPAWSGSLPYWVRRIIERTADRVGGVTYPVQGNNGSWNNHMGHGRINALRAVALARAGG